MVMRCMGSICCALPAEIAIVVIQRMFDMMHRFVMRLHGLCDMHPAAQHGNKQD